MKCCIYKGSLVVLLLYVIEAAGSDCCGKVNMAPRRGSLTTTTRQRVQLNATNTTELRANTQRIVTEMRAVRPINTSKGYELKQNEFKVRFFLSYGVRRRAYIYLFLC